jgi:2-dehydro-3-deoxyphosphogluconate aldolase/(4S)-4-hydroxy-2-oxoglutarate aldolase
VDVRAFEKQPVFGILRGIAPGDLEPLLETIIAAGLKTVEITMNTPGAPDLIRRACALSRGRLTVGAGTVLDEQDLKGALAAGATFIVTPVFFPDITSRCVRDNIPVFPGALTPAEILRSWRSGATMVKVFPSNAFGPAYFKALKGPFPEVRLLACGGVTPENLPAYFDNGASAVSFGASIFKDAWLRTQDWDALRDALRHFLLTLEKSK